MRRCRPRRGAPAADQLPQIRNTRQSVPPCLGEALRRGSLVLILPRKNHHYGVMGVAWVQTAGSPATRALADRAGLPLLSRRNKCNFSGPVRVPGPRSRGPGIIFVPTRPPSARCAFWEKMGDFHVGEVSVHQLLARGGVAWVQTPARSPCTCADRHENTQKSRSSKRWSKKREFFFRARGIQRLPDGPAVPP